MKRIEAIIRPERVQAVKQALIDMGESGLTVYEVQGHGIQKGIREEWRGQKISADLLPKTALIVVVNDFVVQDVVDVITHAARTDRIGDGKIFVTPVEQVIRVRTGETDTDAL